MPDFTFYTKPEYYAKLIQHLAQAKAGDRFITANMITLPWHPEVAAVLTAMTAAAGRGVDVALITDAHNFLIDDDEHLIPGPLLFHRNLPTKGMARRFQLQHDAFEELKSAGGRYVILNRPKHLFASPVMGRCHIKFSLFNDQYYVGGCNLEAYRHLDMMVGASDPRVSGWLAALGDRLLDTANSLAAIGPTDVTYEGTPGSTFYLDAGVKQRSIILRQALNFIDAAHEHITITCQFFPGGITARHLRSASQRGVKVDILYNHPSLTKNVTSFGFTTAEGFERMNNPSDFFRHANYGPNYLHTKLIATEQGAMMGSHNFVQQGVSFGTAEIALLVRDPEFGRQATETVMKQLA